MEIAVARRNISLPDELHAQMETLDINWSAVAQEAFIDAIEIAKLKELNMNKEAGLARLRQSKESNTERLRAEAHKLGATWALEQATYDQLERVAKLIESVDAGGEWRAPGAMSCLANAIDEGQRVEDVAEELFGTEWATDNQVEGFIEGATEVFEEV